MVLKFSGKETCIRSTEQRAVLLSTALPHTHKKVFLNLLATIVHLEYLIFITFVFCLHVSVATKLLTENTPGEYFAQK